MVLIQRVPSPLLAERVDFKLNQFETAIYKKGSDVLYRKAIKCPCKSKGSGNLSSCKNCGGTGWLWINPMRTRMIVQSMNLSPKYLEYGEALLGTISVSSMERDRLSRMDELTILNVETESTETQFLVYNSTDSLYYTYSDYDVIDLYYLAIFVSGSTELVKLELNVEFTIVGRKIVFIDSVDTNHNIYDGAVSEDFSICMRYTHNPKYYVWDVGRDAMTTKVVTGRNEVDVKMPVNAVAMRADLVKDLENYSGDRLLDNSFLTQCDVKGAI